MRFQRRFGSWDDFFNYFKKNVKFAIADSIKTTSGILAIICLISFGLFFMLNDMFGLGIYLFGKKTNPPTNVKKNKDKTVKPIYLPKGGTKY